MKKFQKLTNNNRDEIRQIHVYPQPILEKAVGVNREIRGPRENKARDAAFKKALRLTLWVNESRLFPSAYSACSAVSSVLFAFICHLEWRPINNTPSAATAGANAGISNMHEELNSTKPGETISNAVAKAATNRPLTRRLRKKTVPSRTAANTEVTNRGPRIDGEMRLRICVIRNVCSGGWSFQTSE